MKDKRSIGRGWVSALFTAACCLACIFGSASVGLSQVDDGDRYDQTDSPPPLKIITPSARAQLDAAKNVKERTKLALELMEERLTVANTRADESDFEAMFAELGVFHAIMDDTLSYLDRSSTSRKTVIYNYKRLEIGLRRLTPKIDLLRRNAPAEREKYLFYLARNVRDARAKAIEPLFSDTVVPNRQPNRN